jgi:hypothetical protein
MNTGAFQDFTRKSFCWNGFELNWQRHSVKKTQKIISGWKYKVIV